MRWPVLVLLLVLAAAVAAAQTETSCTACHGDAELLGDELARIVADYGGGAHAAAELGCHHCHGGNPDPALAEDMEAAMDPGFAANPYVGVPAAAQVPGFCGRCHSDPDFMRQYVPDPRVDQEQEYRTSRHGQRLAAGDHKVATCIDCHGVHGILGPGATQSPVYPTNVAETCRRCHGDPDHMAGYTLPDGSPLPVDQYARWRQSVHAHGLLEREDLTAPTCNDCHGNHGALPPGVDSVAFVCGQCHGREARLFRASAKREGFHDHASFLADAEGEGCAACHGDDQPQAALEEPIGFAECTTCHGNHGIVRPTMAMLSPLPETPCAFCHGETTASGARQEEMLRNFNRMRDGLLATAEERGLAGEERFDWLLEQLQRLPSHTQGGGDDGEPELRPEFARLFSKFRIGPTHYTYEDPASGDEVRASIKGCDDCHASAPDLAEAPAGLETARHFRTAMTELTSRTAEAERLLLAARRGGVQTSGAAAEIDQAVEAQIELAVLVHTFSSDPEHDFSKAVQRGMEHSQEAEKLAVQALDELAFRRRGLAASLVVILLVLVALALKIRQMSD